MRIRKSCEFMKEVQNPIVTDVFSTFTTRVYPDVLEVVNNDKMGPLSGSMSKCLYFVLNII